MSIKDYNKNKRVGQYISTTDAQARAMLGKYAHGTKMEVIMDAEWEIVKQKLAKLGLNMGEAMLAGQYAAAKHFYKLIRRNIRAGGAGMGFAPLAEYTVKAKGHDRAFWDSATYYNSIKIIHKGLTVKVGIPPRTKHPMSNLTVSQIATILEYGSQARGIPARPIWHKTWKQFGSSERVRNILQWHLRTRLVASGIL